MVQYKLYYFTARSIAEVIRQIFAYAGVEYEDNRLARDVWQASWKSKTPFGKVPVLDVDGVQIPQSHAIARYLAREFGLYGKTPLEMAAIDVIGDQFKDYWAELAPWFYIHMGYSQGDEEAQRIAHSENARNMLFPHLQKLLKANPSGFLVGDQVSWVDFLIQEHVTILQEEFPHYLEDFPEVLAHAAKIRAIPAIKEWIEKRPKTRG